MNIRKTFKGIDYPIPEFILDSYHSHMSLDYYEREYYLIVSLTHNTEAKKYYVKFEGRVNDGDYLCWTEVTKTLFDEIKAGWEKEQAVFVQFKHDLTGIEGVYMLEFEEIVLSGIEVKELSREVPQFPIVISRTTVPYIYCDLSEPVRIPVRH